MFELIIEWDRIREGEFPTIELQDYGIRVQKQKGCAPFRNKITLSVELEEDDNPINVAFELGRLIQQLQVRG